MPVFIHSIMFVIAIIVTWLCAGFVVDYVWKIAKFTKKNSFFVAFFLLGFLTSLSEFSVAMNSLLNGTPQVSAGNLVGGPIVLLLFLIPILAILGNGITFKHTFQRWQLAFLIGVIVLPSFFFLKGSVDYLDGIIIIAIYGFLVWILRANSSAFQEISAVEQQITVSLPRYTFFLDVGKILAAGALIFWAGDVIVEEAVYFADMLEVPASLVGILLLSFGTNVPEITIAVRSIIKKKAEVALGNYLGSAAMNTLTFGIIALIGAPFVIDNTHFIYSFLFGILGFFLFFTFLWSGHVLSRKEGWVLLCVYTGFMGVQAYTLLQTML